LRPDTTGIERMVAKTTLTRLVILGITVLAAGSGYAQDELRNTFFKDADAALAAAAEKLRKWHEGVSGRRQRFGTRQEH